MCSNLVIGFHRTRFLSDMKPRSGRRKWRSFYEGPSIKARKIGRERPKLYRGHFSVSPQVVSRLATAKSQLILAGGMALNIKVDLLYLAIDNTLSAAVVAKESTLTTTDHKRKIDKFFRHFGVRTKKRSIDRSDLQRFYDLWIKSRYQLYVPKWREVMEMEIFATHIHDVAVTEIARSFKSDETILRKRVDNSVHVYRSESIAETASWIHEQRQFDAEEAGEMYGGKLTRKFLEPWNFVDVLMITDRENIRDLIDKSKEIRKLLKELLDSWGSIVDRLTRENRNRLTAEIAAQKMQRGKASEEEAVRQASEAAAKHSDLLKFRLALSLVLDSSEPRETLEPLRRAIAYSNDIIRRPRSAVRDPWELFKADQDRKKDTSVPKSATS